MPRKFVYPIRNDGKRRDFSNDKEDEQKDQELHSIPLYDPQAVNHGWENGYDNDPINGVTIDYNFLFDNFQLYGFPFDPIQTAHQNLFGNEYDSTTPRGNLCDEDGFKPPWLYKACLNAKRSEPTTPFIALAPNPFWNIPHPQNTHDSGGSRNPPRSRNGPGNTFMAGGSIVEDNDDLNEISQFLLQSVDNENPGKEDEKVDTKEKKKIQSILLRKSVNAANSENMADQPQPEAIENPLGAEQTQEKRHQQPGENGNEPNDVDGVDRDSTTLWMSTATPIPR